MHGPAASRGATLVEYALVFSLLVVVSLGAVEFLTNQASDEINNQADCVSARPAPAACAYAPVPSDVTFPDPGFNPPTTVAPNPALVPTFAVIPPGRNDVTVGWAVELDVELVLPVHTDPPTDPDPMPGVRVRAEITMRDPADPTQDLAERGFTDCTTGSDGLCTLRYDIPYADVDNVKVRIIGVDTTPAPTLPIGVAEFDRPVP